MSSIKPTPPPKIIIVNAEPDGCCRTIKRQYGQTSYVNFLRSGTFGATGVITETNENKE